jgi:hypothetical protein
MVEDVQDLIDGSYQIQFISLTGDYYVIEEKDWIGEAVWIAEVKKGSGN